MRALSANWTFAQVAADPVWYPVSQIPTTAHVELIKLHKIPDPFIGLGDQEVQWVGEADWIFRSKFDVNGDELAQPFVDLVFEGLDTFATVKLNGKTILEANNQFVPYRVSAKDELKPSGNDLEITFESALRKGKEVEQKHGAMLNVVSDSSRLHVRKAQYNYGWDWGPTLMTVGPWKPIYLHAYSARFTDVHVKVDVSEDLSAKVAVTAAASTGASNVLFIIKDPIGAVVHTATESLDGENTASSSFVPDPKTLQLWYPVGYGKQSIYSSEITLLDAAGRVLDTRSDKFGIRRVRLVQEPLVGQAGRSFVFEVNNIRIFVGGSNWIPADSFLTNVTPERYRALLQLAVDGNQNMIRIWGGGIYEPDVFFDICDELGIMVWMDFLFAVAQYPAYDDYLALVEADSEAAVARVRHHPSLVLFAGNNEDYLFAEALNLELDYNDETGDYRNTTFPARHIYERLLPEIAGRLSDVPYHRGSPYSGFGKNTSDQFHGDMHTWNVWHLKEQYQAWDKIGGRFVSEFGMQAYPDIRTVDYWLGGNTTERHVNSSIMINHNKQGAYAEELLTFYLDSNFNYVYYTQLLQSEAMGLAYSLWRREWKGRGKEYVGGALVWQLNDAWPVTSWSIVDYFLRPKPAYYKIARELAPVTVGVKRTTTGDDAQIEIWGSNLRLDSVDGKLDVRLFDLSDPGFSVGWEEDVILGPNASKELWANKLVGGERSPETTVVSARIISRDGRVLARASNWPEPYKDISFPTVSSLALKARVGADGETVTLSTEVPVKGIVLDVAGRSGEVRWSDQAIDLVPGDNQVLRGVGLAGREIKLRFLGDLYA
ncbi:glycoside hydrolase family 2 protein [Auricularia subglabra TFB-10046 SS5]|nr:glycoside hydrolase family 2 protein [Auricularia subglabra TFB-10046 SS5]